MSNRFAYNGKMFQYHNILFFLAFIGCLLSHGVTATSLSINVYLKLTPNNQVITLIKDFNQFLQQNKLLSTYHIRPFIYRHPLHITLYLATYEEQQIDKIIRKTRVLSKKQKRMTIVTDKFLADSSGYVMLTVINSNQIQQLSNKTLNSLAELHDNNASIPQWASQDPQRQAVFMKWGSPNVMNYYHPHFSILDPVHLSPTQRSNLYQKLQMLITQFSKTHSINLCSKADAIGIGIADDQGQIVKELASFALI